MIADNTKHGKNLTYGNNVIIKEGCIIGDNVTLHNNIVIYENTVIGDGCEIFDGAVLGRPPKKAANLVNEISTDLKPLRIGKNCVVGANVVLYNNSILGNDVLLGDLCSIREGCKIGNSVLIARCVTLNHSVQIGNNCKIMDLTHLAGNMTIEDEVFIGIGVSFTNDNNMTIFSNTKKKPAIGAYIHKGAKIGSGSTIAPRVKIGYNSTVSAGSYVIRKVKDNTTVLGVPAKRIF